MSRVFDIKVGTDALALVEFRYPAATKGPDRHVHHEHSDGFYVLEGELTIEVADQTVRAGPGWFVMAPPGVVHTFRNDSSGEARFLNMHVPSMGFHEHLEGRLEDFDQHEPPDDGGLPASEAMIRPA